MSRCVQKPKERFFCPRADIFTSIQPEKTISYVQNWLNVRGVVLAAAQTDRPPALSHHAWRLLIHLGNLEPVVEGSGKSAWRHRQHKEEVDTVVQLASVDVPAVVNSDGRWYGEVASNEVGLMQQICWEMNELAFRLEFATLNSRHSRIGDVKVQYDSARACFPIGTSPIHIVDVGQANQGLAHPDWRSRARYIYALWGLIRNWRLVLPAEVWVEDKEYVKGYTQHEMEKLETALIGVYTDTFFVTFGRAPTLPMVLPTTRQTEWVIPVPSEMTPGFEKRWRPHWELRKQPWYLTN